MINRLFKVTFFCFAISAQAGTSSGGGGSDTPPTAAEIQDAVRTLISRSQMSENFEAMRSVGSRASDPELASFFKRITESNYAEGFIQNVLQTPYSFKAHGPCEGLDGDQEASVQSNTLRAPICFSLEWIAAAMPKVTLNESLNPLIMHEVSHQYGADELLAKKVEAFFSSRQSLYRRQVTAFEETYFNVGQGLAKLKKLLGKQSSSDAALCASLGRIAGLMRALDHQGGHLPDEAWNWDVSLASSDVFDIHGDRMLGFCEENDFSRNRQNGVSVGDRAALRLEVREVELKYRDLGSKMEQTLGTVPYDPSQDPTVN